MKKHFFAIVLIVFFLAVGLSFLYAQDSGGYKVIVNAQNPVDSMGRDEVSKLFLKKVGSWAHGVTALPVDQLGTAEVREKFSKDIHGKSVATVKNYWQQQIFSGRNAPPPEKASDDEVLSYVKSNTGAIGYVSGKADTGELKVLKVTK